MKYLILFILANILSLPTIAQTTSFTGTLKLDNGKPVADANIVIKELNKYTLTDENGKFDFSGIPYGKYEIEVFSLEIKKKQFHIEIKANSNAFTFEVEPSDISLNEIEISANSTKKTIETKGFAVNIIETQQVAIQSIQTNELLERTAGVKVRQDGGLGSHIKYNINGLSGNAVKIFIDGVPASNYGPSFSLSSIPPALIERIEVYKGVVPGHLSEDVLGGAINVVLKQQRKKSLTTSYSYGSFNTHQWNATGNYRWQNGLTVEGSAFYNYSDNNYKVWGKDIEFMDHLGTITKSNGKKVKRFHDGYESLGGKFNVGFTNVKWADQFMLGGIFSKTYKEVQNGVTMKLVYGNRHNRRKSDVLTLLYNKKDLFTKGLSLKVDATHSYLDRQVIDSINIRYDWSGKPVMNDDGTPVTYVTGGEASRNKTAQKDKEYTNMMRANLSYQITDNHTIYGNYLFNNFERKISDEFLALALQKLRNTRDLQKNVLAFTYESLLFSDKLRTNIFYKHYIQDVVSNEAKQDGTEFYVNELKQKMDENGYGLTMSYALLPYLHLLTSVEKAVRMPSEDEIFGNMTGETLLLSSFDLKPERSTNFNIGFNFGSYKINKHAFNLNATFFFRNTEDMIRESYTTGNETSSQFKNLENVETRGLDVELNYNYDDKINFRFNASKFDVLFNTQYDERGNVYNYYRTQICNEPSFKLNSNITYYHSNFIQKGSRASIYYNINYVNGFLRSWEMGTRNIDKVPAQYPMDLGLTYAFPKNKIVLSLDAKNILNEQAFDNFGLQKPGRAFFGKITYYIL